MEEQREGDNDGQRVLLEEERGVVVASAPHLRSLSLGLRGLWLRLRWRRLWLLSLLS